ncbi:hypothetical protein BG004_006104, partial [Podila humilis]
NGGPSKQTRSSSGALSLALPDDGLETSAEDSPSQLDDYFCALFLQRVLIVEDSKIGSLGKLNEQSDKAYAIERLLQEARDLEESYRLAKSLSMCEPLPEQTLQELEEQDRQALRDHELAMRISRVSPETSALSLQG